MADSGGRALVTAQTGSCLLRVAMPRVVDRVGVCHELSAHDNHVCFARGNDFLRFLDARDAAYDRDGNVYVGTFLYRCRPFHVVAVGQVDGGHCVGHPSGFDDEALGNVDGVDVLLREFDEFDRLLDAHTALDKLVSANSHIDGNVVAYAFANGAQHLEWISVSALKASAVMICSLVEQWRQELSEQVAVCRMDLDHVEVSGAQTLHHIAIRVLDSFEISVGHCPDMGVAALNWDRRRRDGFVGAETARRSSSCVHELYRQLRVVAVDCLRKTQ